MAILVCYKNLKIGKLTYENDLYSFKLLPDAEKLKDENPFIKLPFKTEEKSSFLPAFFENLVKNIKTNWLVVKAQNINLEQDTDYEILQKYAKANQKTDTFYLVNS